MSWVFLNVDDLIRYNFVYLKVDYVHIMTHGFQLVIQISGAVHDVSDGYVNSVGCHGFVV